MSTENEGEFELTKSTLCDLPGKRPETLDQITGRFFTQNNTISHFLQLLDPVSKFIAWDRRF